MAVRNSHRQIEIGRETRRDNQDREGRIEYSMVTYCTLSRVLKNAVFF